MPKIVNPALTPLLADLDKIKQLLIAAADFAAAPVPQPFAAVPISPADPLIADVVGDYGTDEVTDRETLLFARMLNKLDAKAAEIRATPVLVDGP